MPTDDDVERIIAAAWRVLERSRFRTLKVRQVLDVSGVSANGFYRRFPSKTHLLLALLEDEMLRAASQLNAHMASAASLESELRTWLEHLIAIAYDDHRAERARLFLDPTLLEEQPHEVERLHHTIIAPLEDLITRGSAQGTFHSTDPRIEAKAIYHMVRGFTHDRLAGLLTWSQDQVMDTAYNLVLRALSSPASGFTDG